MVLRLEDRGLQARSMGGTRWKGVGLFALALAGLLDDVLGADNVVEVGGFDDDGAVGGTTEGVFLAVVENVAEAVEVVAFEHEAACAFGADLKGEASGDAVLEAALDGFAVLLCDVVGSRRAGPGVAIVFGLAEAVAELGTYEEAEEEAFALATPAEAREDGHLDIPHIAVVGVAAEFGVDVFLPAHVGVVDFGLYGADGGEVFLTGVAHGDAEGLAALKHLLDGGVEGGAVEEVAAVEAYGEVVAVFAYLRLEWRTEQHGKEQEEAGGLHQRLRLMSSMVWLGE